MASRCSPWYLTAMTAGSRGGCSLDWGPGGREHDLPGALGSICEAAPHRSSDTWLSTGRDVWIMVPETKRPLSWKSAQRFRTTLPPRCQVSRSILEPSSPRGGLREPQVLRRMGWSGCVSCNSYVAKGEESARDRGPRAHSHTFQKEEGKAISLCLSPSCASALLLTDRQ